MSGSQTAVPQAAAPATPDSRCICAATTADAVASCTAKTAHHMRCPCALPAAIESISVCATRANATSTTHQTSSANRGETSPA